ncbi:MAG: T9SS type A sorting domain-containing protein [Saprospiraceae bacterium]
MKWESLSKFPFIRGALMVRPIFGNTRPLPTRVVETPGSNSDLNVFPNPTSGQINFELPYGKLEDFQVSVFNSLGQMILNQALNENGIQLAAQEEGMYILRINNTQTREIWTKKIIKF